VTPRQAVRKLVEDYASTAGISTGSVWAMLYARFEHLTNWALRREANNADEKPLDLIDRLGRMDDLLEVAMEHLRTKAPF
jgi:hypothetical protein